MNDYEQIMFRLKEAEIYLKFLNENINSGGSINKDLAFQIEQLLKEVTKKLQESANMLSLRLKAERKYFQPLKL